MPYIGKQPTVGNFQVCDAISVVNGQAAYTMQVGGSNVEPESANHMLVSLNGILQKPGSSFTISGSTITFASNLATGDVIDFITLLGDTLNTGVPSDDTITAAKLNDDIISGQTALTSAPDSTDELLISDGGTLKRIDVSLIGGDNTPSFKAHLSGNQTIGTSSFTKAALATEVWDTDSAWDTSNYRFTVPSGEGGKYVFTARFLFYNLADSNVFEARFYKNGSALGGSTFRETGSNSSQQVDNSSTIVVNLSASDYIELYVNQNTGGNQTLYGPGNGDTSLTGYKLIGV